jgi:hypothetical protein
VGTHVQGGGRRLRNRDDPAARDPEDVDHVVGDRVGGHDHPGGAMDREVAQLQAKAGSKVFPAALELDDVVDGDDHRHGAAEHRAVDPRRVVDVAAPRVVRLDELVCIQALAQGVEQATGVPANSTVVLRRATVECDFHGDRGVSPGPPNPRFAHSNRNLTFMWARFAQTAAMRTHLRWWC